VLASILDVIGFISTSDVRVAGLVVLTFGIGCLVIVGRRNRDAWPLAALGSTLSTWGSILVWQSLDKIIDAPDGWNSVTTMMSSTFDSWLWVVIFGIVSSLIWLAVLAITTRGTLSLWTSIATVCGAALAAVSAGFLDSSISR